MMNKRELIYSIAEKTGYTQSAVRNVLNTFINTVFEEVKSENKVRIGGLGVFFRAADDLVRKLNKEEE